MSAFRITMTFDLDVGDEAMAQQIAEEYLSNLSLRTIAEGGRVEGDSTATIRNPRALASTLAVVLLARGVDTVYGTSVGNVNVGSEQR